MPLLAVIGVSCIVLGLIGTYFAAAFKFPPEAAAAAASLMAFGGTLFGKERFEQSRAAKEKYSERPPGMNTIVWAVLLVLLPLLGSCAWWNTTGKPVARTLNDIAREYCEASMVREARRRGISARELCILPDIFEPFLQAPQQAMALSRAQRPPVGAP